jgi:hypothetical protein
MRHPRSVSHSLAHHNLSFPAPHAPFPLPIRFCVVPLTSSTRLQLTDSAGIPVLDDVDLVLRQDLEAEKSRSVAHDLCRVYCRCGCDMVLIWCCLYKLHDGAGTRGSWLSSRHSSARSSTFNISSKRARYPRWALVSFFCMKRVPVLLIGLACSHTHEPTCHIADPDAP